MMYFNVMHVGKCSKASEAELLKNVTHYDQLWLSRVLMDNISIKTFLFKRLHQNEALYNNAECLLFAASQCQTVCGNAPAMSCDLTVLPPSHNML